MFSFIINLEVMNRMGAQRNKTIRGWYDMQRSDKTPVKANGTKSNNSFGKVGNITLVG